MKKGTGPIEHAAWRKSTLDLNLVHLQVMSHILHPIEVISEAPVLSLGLLISYIAIENKLYLCITISNTPFRLH